MPRDATPATQQGATEIALAAQALGETMDGIESLRVELVHAIEYDAIQLGLQLAEKILGGTRQLPNERILEAVQGALRRVTDRRKITVFVNPAEFEAVSSAIGELAGPGSGIELCDIQPDERVEPGGASCAPPRARWTPASRRSWSERVR